MHIHRHHHVCGVRSVYIYLCMLYTAKERRMNCRKCYKSNEAINLRQLKSGNIRLEDFIREATTVEATDVSVV